MTLIVRTDATIGLVDLLDDNLPHLDEAELATVLGQTLAWSGAGHAPAG